MYVHTNFIVNLCAALLAWSKCESITHADAEQKNRKRLGGESVCARAPPPPTMTVQTSLRINLAFSSGVARVK